MRRPFDRTDAHRDPGARPSIAARGARAKRIWIPAVIALALVAQGPLAPGPSIALSKVKRQTKRVAPGVVFKHFSVAGPNHVYALVVDPTKTVALDTALASRQLPGYAKTSEIVRANNAIAGINGDFGISPGRPAHPMADGGDLIQDGPQIGAGFAYSANERRSYIGAPQAHIQSTDAKTGQTWTVNRWNDGNPKAGEIAGYTAVGGSAERPPGGGCSVRLARAGRLSWSKNGQAVRPYTVSQNGCSTGGPAPGDVVLNANTGGTKARILRRLPMRSKVTIKWGFGWSHAVDEISGNPVILRKGRNVAPPHCGSYFCDRNPRTGIGYKKNGDVVLMVVDGRRPGYSVGMTLPQFAAVFKRLGCSWAMNLDGGGSTTMVVHGRIVNRPSDSSGERDITNALIVLRRSESRSASIVSAPVQAPMDPAEVSAAWQQALHDPGSTGGLLQAVASGGLGSGSGAIRAAPHGP